MAIFDNGNGKLHYQLDGADDAPLLVLSNSLGTTLDMWVPQMPALLEHFRVLRYDTRGHGGSPVTPGPYRMDDLGQDVLALLDALNIDQAYFCGISMGGHTGLWLGVQAGARMRGIAVCNSAAKIGTAQAWQERAATVRSQGAAAMQALADSAPGRWFTPGFTQAHPDVVQRAQAWIAGIAPEGYAACCEALATSDLRDSISRIGVPTLLLAGADDPVTTVADAQAMQDSIAGSSLAIVPASLLSNLEALQAFEQAVLDFLAHAAKA